jgi:hypothetical protein
MCVIALTLMLSEEYKKGTEKEAEASIFLSDFWQGFCAN